ncbi:MAG: hypothetical protein II916_04430 [Oscillospiraceae bacterium]|nr:hypothetical protein [Oscillospiraceae bacterium]
MADQARIRQLMEEEDKKLKRSRKWLVIIPVVLIVLLIGGWFLLGVLWNHTAQSQMESRVSKAHSFANVVHEWQDRGNDVESGIYHVDAGDGEFNKFVEYYFGDAEGEWFGLVLDDDGEIEYTMYSRKEIPEECLQTPPDFDEQNKLLRSHFFFKKKQVIAVWTPEDDWMPDGSES